jgi:hypothetical protein
MTKSLHSIFHCLKAEFDAGMLFFQLCHFLGMPKSQMEQHTLILNKTSLNNQTCCSLIPSTK